MSSFRYDAAPARHLDVLDRLLCYSHNLHPLRGLDRRHRHPSPFPGHRIGIYTAHSTVPAVPHQGRSIFGLEQQEATTARLRPVVEADCPYWTVLRSGVDMDLHRRVLFRRRQDLPGTRSSRQWLGGRSPCLITFQALILTFPGIHHPPNPPQTQIQTTLRVTLLLHTSSHPHPRPPQFGLPRMDPVVRSVARRLVRDPVDWDNVPDIGVLAKWW